MEKIAVISDIHGNLPALEAVVKDIRRRRIKRILCLGDLVGKGPQPAETVDRVREICEQTVQGNWDIGINRPQDKAAGIWQQEKLGAERLDYLRSLPYCIDLQLSGKWLRLFHASALSVDHRVPRKAPKKDKLSLFQHTAMTGMPLGSDSEPDRIPDIVGYGDIHIPYLQTIKTKQKKGLIVFNTGSVGAPYDGIPAACYTIVEGIPESAAAGPYSIQTVRVPYDIDKAIAIAEETGMPGIERFRYEMKHGVEM
ncbi:metallophosphatase family protein [Paenibacillus doosanensis]|uniref:metallophosphoesterase family protein n=1 Tax=Paenibacillus doosanensis TaxID=1229154 RepID=UPI0021804954|nr:metallophosphoesterase family protein [Paenibacillus doosanensis]MCS7460196.1 metallophosphatase family protein [Paenibacillus doosanensis]